MPNKVSQPKKREDPITRAAWISVRGSVIVGICTLVAATIAAGWWRLSRSPKSLVVSVRNTVTESVIRGANVRLESEGVPPTTQSSDTNGIVQFRLDEPKKEVHIWIEADGFEKGDWQIVPADTGNFNARLIPTSNSVAPSPPPNAVSRALMPPSTPSLEERQAARRYTTDCRTLFEKGEFQSALSECNKALRVSPSNKEALELKRKVQNTIKILDK